MKFNTYILAAAVAVLLAGCKNDDVNRTHYDNKLYISTTSFTEELLLKNNVSVDSREIVARIAKPERQPIEVEFAAAPELLETYRNAYYDSAVQLLPSEQYAIDEPRTTIKERTVASAPVAVRFIDLNLLDREARYVLPVRIASATGIGVLESARTLYYVFKGASLVNVVADIDQNWVWPTWQNAAPVTNMSRFTLEALVYGETFSREISTIMGIEGIFLVRAGDSGLPKNQIQVATANNKNLTAAALQLEPKRWYHLAVSFDAGAVTIYLDGVARCSGTVTASPVNFGVEHSDEADGKPRCFWIGYSYDKNRYFDGMIAEARIWNRVLTAEEINAQDHFYSVDPDAEGLVAYWKFDEGAGRTVKDHSAYGNDLTAFKDIEWVKVALPEKK